MARKTGGTEHFMHYRTEHGDVDEMRVSKPRAGVKPRLYRFQTDKPRYVLLVQHANGLWNYKSNEGHNRLERPGSEEFLMAALRWEGRSVVEKVKRAISRKDYRLVRGERHFFPIVIGRDKEKHEIIDLRDGRWTVLWAGLEYGPKESLESLFKPGSGLPEIMRAMERKKQYVLVKSVADVLETHYDR